MPAPILYCGDTSLDTAASYLAGVITHCGWTFDYIPSHECISREVIERRHKLLILSDYPAAQFDKQIQLQMLDCIERGAGLLMIGGWESYRGCDGRWQSTPLGKALPVEIGRRDDRVNFAQPTLLTAVGQGPAIEGLPWREEPPTIGGLNHVRAKQQSQTLLVAASYKARELDGEVVFEKQKPYPALVLGKQGKGRTAAFASDVAPHWVGGFVDWGPQRVLAQARGASAIEVGSHYAQFWKQLLAWTGRLK